MDLRRRTCSPSHIPDAMSGERTNVCEFVSSKFIYLFIFRTMVRYETCPTCLQKCSWESNWNVCEYDWQMMTSLEKKEARDDKLAESKQSINILAPALARSTGAARHARQSRVSEKQSDRWFVTVGLKDGVDIQKAWARCLKFIKMAKVDKAYAQMDQSGEEIVKHPHMHIFMEYNKQMYKGKVIQVFSCAFTDYIGGDNHIDVKPGGEYHHKYFQGLKCEEKLDIVRMSRKWREENNLPQYIEKDAQSRILSYASQDLPSPVSEANRTPLQDEAYGT